MWFCILFHPHMPYWTFCSGRTVGNRTEAAAFQKPTNYISLLEMEHREADIVCSAGCQESASGIKRVLWLVQPGTAHASRVVLLSALSCCMGAGGSWSNCLPSAHAGLWSCSTSGAYWGAQITWPDASHLHPRVGSELKALQTEEIPNGGCGVGCGCSAPSPTHPCSEVRGKWPYTASSAAVFMRWPLLRLIMGALWQCSPKPNSNWPSSPSSYPDTALRHKVWWLCVRLHGPHGIFPTGVFYDSMVKDSNKD